MSLDALVLALASVIRLTSLAAVYAMLSAARPARLLAAYIVAGFAFSAAVGIVLVILVGVPAGPQGPEDVRAVIAFVLAAISLGYAAGLLVERLLRPRRDATGAAPGPGTDSWLGRRLAHLSTPGAALAGILTHLPGVFYLAALSAIIGSTSSDANRIFQVIVYNAIWLAMPMAALAMATRRPVELQDLLLRVTNWIWRRQRAIVITAFGLLGVYLIVRGVGDLQS
jgi:hypothetical protein